MQMAVTWAQCQFKGTAPPARSSHTLTNVLGDLLIMGGQGLASICSDLFLVKGDTFETRSLYPVERLEERIGHSAIPLFGNVYVWGGWNSQRYLDYGALYDVESTHLLVEENKNRKLPPARRDHSLTRIGRQM